MSIVYDGDDDVIQVVYALYLKLFFLIPRSQQVI